MRGREKERLKKVAERKTFADEPVRGRELMADEDRRSERIMIALKPRELEALKKAAGDLQIGTYARIALLGVLRRGGFLEEGQEA